jgi:hypothetical protein
MTASFDSELTSATAAAWRARSEIQSVDRAGLDARHMRALRLLKNRLEEAVRGVPKDFDTPIRTVYGAVRQALSEFDKLERGVLSEGQRQHVSAAVSVAT